MTTVADGYTTLWFPNKMYPNGPPRGGADNTVGCFSALEEAVGAHNYLNIVHQELSDFLPCAKTKLLDPKKGIERDCAKALSH